MAAQGISLRFFSEREYLLVQHIVRRIIPQSAMTKLNVALKIDSLLSQARKRTADKFRLVLALIEYGGMWSRIAHARFSKMSVSQQERYLASWERSAWEIKRIGFQAVKRICLGAFYGSEESWGLIGYKTDSSGRESPHAH